MTPLTFAPNYYIRQTAQKILEFRKLPLGWHYGKGVPLTDETVSKALALNEEAGNVGFTITNAFPGPEGEIQVTVYRGSTYLEFTVERDGTITFVHERNKQEIEYQENVPLSEALTKIHRLRGQIWALSGSSIKGTTIREHGHFQAWPLSPLQMMESPLSTKTAYYRGELVSVNISNDFTKTFPAHHLSSGKFQIISFQKIVGSPKIPVIQEMSATTTS